MLVLELCPAAPVVMMVRTPLRRELRFLKTLSVARCEPR